MARIGLSQANTLRSNNLTSTGYGIVYADEVISHKSVSNLEALYGLFDWQLSIDGKNTNNDALGQRWYVLDADGNGNGAYYQLINWESRKTADGWKAVYTSDQALADAKAYTDKQVGAEKTRAEAAEKANADAITAETTRATKAEGTLTTSVNTVSSDLAQEVKDRTAADTTLQTNIDNEVTRAKAAEAANAKAITDSLAEAKEYTDTEVGEEVTNRRSAINSIYGEDPGQTPTHTIKGNADDLAAEITRAKAAEKANADAIATKVAKDDMVEITAADVTAMFA